MKHIGEHMSSPNPKMGRATERGELMRYFMQKLNMTRGRDGLQALTMARMGKTLEAIPTLDLYYLKSVCDDAQKRGDSSSFSKKFWWELNPKNHTEQAKEAALKSSNKKFTRKKRSTEHAE